MKSMPKILLIVPIVIIIISIGIISFKYLESTSNKDKVEQGNTNFTEKYTPLENLTSNDFDLMSCLKNNYYTLISSEISYSGTNDFIVYYKDELDSFIANVNSNIPDVIRVVQYGSDEKESFIKDIEFNKDKFIVKNDYRGFGDFSEEDRKIVTNEYDAKKYKLIVDSTPIVNEGAKTYYNINLVPNNNSEPIYLCNYFEIPEDTESNFKLEFISDSSKGRQLILSKSENSKYNYDIYSYNGDVNIIINNEKFALRDALLNNKISVEEILDKANKDAEESKIFKGAYSDGGSVDYFYTNYTILKYHTLGGNRDMYIGELAMDRNALDDLYYNLYERPSASVTFQAVVVKASDKSLLIFGTGNSSGLCSTGIGNTENVEFKQGQEVLIYYDGTELETYPPQLANVEKVEIIKEKSDAEIPENVLKYAYSSPYNVTISLNELTKNGISFTVKDTNELQYEFSNEYSLSKKVKNENYTGVGQVIGENTENSTAGYTGTGVEYIFKGMEKLSDVPYDETIKISTNGDTKNIEINWSRIYGELGERRVYFCIP